MKTTLAILFAAALAAFIIYLAINLLWRYANESEERRAEEEEK